MSAVLKIIKDVPLGQQLEANMTHKWALFLILSLVCGYSPLAWSNQTIVCSEFKGSQISVSGTGVESISDGYSGQTIMLHLSENGEAEVEWSGPNRFKVPVTFAGVSEAEGWAVWVQYHQEVYRTYTFFMKTRHLALTESQAQLFTGIPSVKTMLGKCR